tara:strand:- start:67 stop:675 length:609 start_codon:yes stop_codon:yes gene_type:complete
MGIFSKVMSFTGIGNLDKLTRTGGTQAAKNAKSLGEVSLAEQQALKQEIGGIYDPRMQAGNQAFGELADFYGGNQQPIIDMAKGSEFMSSLVNAGEESIARNAKSTGGWRTGTSNENLAGNSQNVLMGLVQQLLQGKQGIAQSGYGAQDAYTNAMQNITAGAGATRGQIANVDISRAAQKQNMYSGLANAGISAYTAYTGGV